MHIGVHIWIQCVKVTGNLDVCYLDLFDECPAKILFDRSRIRIPTLENVYQTMEKQQEILLREAAKINAIKAKIGIKDRNTNEPLKPRYQFNKPDVL